MATIALMIDMGSHEKKMYAVGKDRVKRGTSARDSGDNGNAEVWFGLFFSDVTTRFGRP